MAGGVVYHWKHGYIPLDHYAALKKAHGSQIGAARIMARHDISDGPKSLHSVDRSNGGKGKASAPEVSAPGSWSARQRPDGSFSVHAKDGSELGRVRQVTAGKHKGKWEGRVDGRHGADHAASPEKTIDAMYDSVHGMPGAAAQARAGGSPEERRLAAYKAAIRQHQATQAKPGGTSTAPAASAHTARAEQLRAAAAKKRAEADRIANGAGVNDRAAAMLSGRTHQRQVARDDSALRRFSEKQREAKALESKAHLAEGRAKTAAEKQDAASLGVTAAKLSPGDLIQHKGTAHLVTKVNRTTVSVPSIVGGSWEDKLPISGISKHVPVSQLKDANLRALYAKASGGAKTALAAEMRRRGLLPA